MFIGGKSDWGVYQNPGRVDVMQHRACTQMVGIHSGRRRRALGAAGTTRAGQPARSPVPAGSPSERKAVTSRIRSTRKCREAIMNRMVSTCLGLLLALAIPNAVFAQADLRKPAGKDWPADRRRLAQLALLDADADQPQQRQEPQGRLGGASRAPVSARNIRSKARRSSKTASCTSRPATMTSMRSTPGPAR